MSDRDIVDDIDALIDEQLAAGPVDDYSINRYDKCPKCERDWHGIPLTLQVAVMYSLGVYDNEYEAAKDRSPVVCPGSDNDEPLPEFTDDLRRLTAHYAAITLQRMGRIPAEVDIADLIADSFGPNTGDPVRPDWMRPTPGAPAWINDMLTATWNWVQQIDRGIRGVAPRRVVQVFVGDSRVPRGHDQIDHLQLDEAYQPIETMNPPNNEGTSWFIVSTGQTTIPEGTYMRQRHHADGSITTERVACETNPDTGETTVTSVAVPNPSHGRPGFGMRMADQMTPGDITQWVAGDEWQALARGDAAQDRG